MIVSPGAVTTSPPIVGREDELRAISDFLVRMLSEPCALVLEGSAGIGKSTLLEAAVRAATDRSVAVLRCGPVDHESRLSFAALRDLLEPVFDEIAAKIPVPQRRALSVALLREDPEAPLDPGAIAAAFLTLLRERSRTNPVLVVVDDTQWLDGPTANVLAFAVRRLRDEPVGLLLALRSDAGPRAGELDLAMAPERLRRVTLGPLSLGALQAILRGHLGRSWPRPLLRRIHDASAGNPLFALEIARALEDDALSPGSALPVPSDLAGLLRARIVSLPRNERFVLAIASAASRPTPDLVAAASGLGPAAGEALSAAETAGVIAIRDGQLRFTHPVLGSTVYANTPPDDRRAAHRALADLSADREERARHLALSSDGPDAAIAAELDEAAYRARARGAPDSAAELAELAIELTPPGDDTASARRVVEAAGHLFDAGNAIRAQELLRHLADRMPRGPARADVLRRLADASWMDVDLVRHYLEEGLADATGDGRSESAIRLDLAWAWIYGGNVERATAESRRSLELAEAVDESMLMPEALATLGICEFLAGHDGADRIERAVSLRAAGSLRDTYTTPRVAMGLRFLWAGDLDAARATLEAVLEDLADRGLYTLATEPLEYLAEVECRAGRYDVGARHAAMAIEVKLGAGFEEPNALDLYPQALVDALRGDSRSARDLATRGIGWAKRGDHLYANGNRAVLGFVALSEGRFAEAREHLDAVIRFLRDMGVREPCVIPVHADGVEARIGVGDLDGASALLEEFEDLARASGRIWALAAAGRCRALLLAARRSDADERTDEALAILDDTQRLYERVPMPFELGRTLLARGSILRRARRRREARETLEHALAMFDELGSPLWAANARAELGRIGGRRSTGDELTPTEQRIAELVAAGNTNREVAAALVVAERTVESTLTQIYRKLDVRSRTELARRLSPN